MLIDFSDSVCPDDWYFYDDLCVQISEKSVPYDNYFEACTKGEPYFDTIINLWIQDLDLGDPTELWGQTIDGVCYDGLQNTIECTQEKKIVCSLKGNEVCGQI